jgi:tetratricopeptide (TPR) repeat protein
LCALALPAAGQGDDAQAVFAKVAPAVVTVVAHDESGAVAGQGSGVAVAAERVATNCHVVRDAHRLTVQHAGGERAAQWTRADRSRDLCLLDVAGLAAAPARIRPLAELAVGERVHAVGNPLGFGLSVASGLISHFAEIGGERVILTSAPQSPGSSGGGLFDDEGRLVGLSTSVLTAGQNINVALPAEWIDALGERGVAPAPRPVAPGPEPRWIGDANALMTAAAWPQLEAHALAWRTAQPTSALANVLLAMALDLQDRTQDAERALREALRLDERNANAWSRLARILRRADRHDEAERALARALEIHPDFSEAHADRAAWLLEDGRAEQALPYIERALASDPHTLQYWQLLGSIRHALGQPDEARRAYQAALVLNERDEKSRNALVQLLAKSGRDDEAHRALARAAGRTTDARTWLAMGITDFNQQRYVTAEDAFRKATEAAPDEAEGWEKLGMTLARTLRDQEAGPALERALELDPGLFEARIERANLRARRGDLKGAVADAQRATELAPADPRAWRLHAVHSVAAQDLRAAIASYRRVEALGKAGVDDYADLGDLLGKVGDKIGAQAIFAKAEQIDPRHARMLVNQAGFHGRNGRLDKAQEYLERALEVEPRNAHALSSKGYVQLLRGQAAEAVATLQRAVVLDPQLANGWINLGHAYLRSRDVGRAIPALEKALALAPQALDAHLYIAQSYLAARQNAKALHHAESVLARQPDLPAALGIVTLAHLLEGRSDAAAASYGRLRARNAQAAQRLKAQAIAGGLPAARDFPE